MNKRHDIVIVGAGVVGLALAASLVRAAGNERLRITLVDAGKAAEPVVERVIGLRVYAMSVGSCGFLESVGVGGDMLAGRACPYRDMRVWDSTGTVDGPATLHFSAAGLALPQLGVIVEDNLLRNCLQRILADLPLELRFGTAIQSIADNGRGHDIVLSDGTSLHADLLVGADGASSTVRRFAAIDVKSWRYPQSALVTHALCERPHQHTAWQRFANDGIIALLPLVDGRVSIVWSTDPDTARDMAAGDAGELSRRLTDVSDSVLGTLQVNAPCGSFPLRAQHAREYVRRGIALTGDAAHTVHPLAGQGANLGLADAATLAAVIGEALDRGEHPGDLPVLRRYERARRGANGNMLHVVDGLSRLFRNDSDWLAAARSAGMQVFNRTTIVKHKAMRAALGLDIPQSVTRTPVK